MKEQVKNEDRKEFEKISRIFSVLFLAMMITPIPLIQYLKDAGIVPVLSTQIEKDAVYVSFLY